MELCLLSTIEFHRGMPLNKLFNTKGAHYLQNIYYQPEKDLCLITMLSFANTGVEQANNS